MLYNALKRLISLNKTAGLREKIDVLYAAGSLTTEQYNEIIALLPQE